MKIMLVAGMIVTVSRARKRAKNFQLMNAARTIGASGSLHEIFGAGSLACRRAYREEKCGAKVLANKLHC